MTMKLKNHLVFSSLSFLLFCSAVVAQSADVIFYNGIVHTLNADQPKAEAIVISDNRIHFVGPSNEALALKEEATQLIDLDGLAIIPGFIESHAHFYSLGQSKQQLDLTNASSYEVLVQQVKDAVALAAPGDWILGRGWHQSKWDPQPSPLVKGFQTHHKLSEVSPDNPVYLVHASGHAAFANTKAMSLANINSSTKFSDGGEILKNQAGEPTGVLVENAMGLVSALIGNPSPERQQQAYKLAMDEALSYGITSFHDAGASADDIENIYKLGESGELSIRVYAMLNGNDESLLNSWFDQGPKIGLYDNFLTIRGIKLWADGALGSRGAWLTEEYRDRPGHFGSATISMDLLSDITQRALTHNFQMAVHAIGDRGNKEVLDRFENAFSKNNEDGKAKRFRIEHAQHLNRSDIPRFSQLGVIASMQSIHMSSDRPWAIDRLGIKRIEEGAYVWQKLIDSGALIVNGTDAPVEPINPFANFYAAITRKTLQGTPQNGYESSQKMSRLQALQSYTINAAYAAFEEDVKGSIEVGKLADLVVLSQDLLSIPENQVMQTKALLTMVDGKIVFTDDEFNKQ